MFNVEYLLKRFNHLKEMELAQLNQGNLLVIDYAQQFLKLGLHSPDSMTNEGMKARRFEWDLRPEIN